MFAGRFTLGQRVPLLVRTLNDSGTPTNPTGAPVVVVYDSSGNVAKSFSLPIRDQGQITGLFLYDFNLENSFATGTYDAMINWVVGSTAKARVISFDVVAGGDVDGSGIAMHYFRHPARNFVLLQTDDGKLKKLRNPQLS